MNFVYQIIHYKIYSSISLSTLLTTQNAIINIKDVISINKEATNEQWAKNMFWANYKSNKLNCTKFSKGGHVVQISFQWEDEYK